MEEVVLAKLEFKIQVGGLCVIVMLLHAYSVPRRDSMEICALTVTMFEAKKEFLSLYCSF